MHEERPTRIRLLRVTDCSIIDLMNITISGYMELRETEKNVHFIHSDILQFLFSLVRLNCACIRDFVTDLKGRKRIQ